MFARNSLIAHLARGAIGVALLLGAYRMLSTHPAVSIGFAIGGLVALGGCPTCWTLGLIEKLTSRKECIRCSK